jgi:protein tyrosine/serine phosphatase
MAGWRGLWPTRMHSRRARLAAWVDLWVVDLGLLRAPVNRPVEIAPGIWRSNQPSPWRLRRLATAGFKTIINLRGEGKSGAFHLERYHTEQLGMTLYSLKMSSRRLPTRAQVQQLQQLFREAPKPMLLHCKSGADRAGLAAAICLLEQDGTVDDALRQLSFRYLHIRSASTGMMDHFVEAYGKAQSETGIGFDEWLETEYDRDALSKTFKPNRAFNWLTDKLLRRE